MPSPRVPAHTDMGLRQQGGREQTRRRCGRAWPGQSPARLPPSRVAPRAHPRHLVAVRTLSASPRCAREGGMRVGREGRRKQGDPIVLGDLSCILILCSAISVWVPRSITRLAASPTIIRGSASNIERGRSRRVRRDGMNCVRGSLAADPCANAMVAASMRGGAPASGVGRRRRAKSPRSRLWKFSVRRLRL